MAVLLTTQTTDTTGNWEEVTGPVDIQVSGVMGGARVTLQARRDTADASGFGQLGTIQDDSHVQITLQGTYDVRAILSGSGPATSVTVTATEAA